MNIPKITLLSTEDCSLCISARKTVQEVSENTGAELEELNITQTPELHKLYATQVPVVLVDGKPHDFWTINEDRLTQAIRSKINARIFFEHDTQLYAQNTFDHRGSSSYKALQRLKQPLE